MKLFYWLRLKIKKFLTKYMLLIEICNRCGDRVRQVWHVNDELFIKLNGSKYGCLCIRCFDKIADDNHIILYWTANEREFK